MIISGEFDGQTLKLDDQVFYDLSIPLNFNGPQPNAYGVEKANSVPCQAGDLVGDTRRGGSCNFEQYTFIPHCNGTHTECIGHITHERIAIRDCLQEVFIPAQLLSVTPEEANSTHDSYPVEVLPTDKLITAASIQNPKSKLQNSDALIIRTLPNDKDKLTQKYGEYVPPFFSNEAMDLLIESGVRHLLVDLPSIDRLFDEGGLSNHRKFWKVAAGEFDVADESRTNCTITELIYVPDEIVDGAYLLNLQIAPFHADVSPSRPIIFPMQQTGSLASAS